MNSSGDEAVFECYLEDEKASEMLGAAIADAVAATNSCRAGSTIIYFYGDLGAGKTTTIRGLLRHLGHQGAVKSPTYTLVEPYILPLQDSGDIKNNGITNDMKDYKTDAVMTEIFHLDLYRLGDPEELELLGMRDFVTGDSLILIEWPERATGYLPPATLKVRLGYDSTGRRCQLGADSPDGARLLESVRNGWRA